VDPNVNTTSEERPPLVVAALMNDIDLAELLLDAGADINTPDVLETAAGDSVNYDILNFLIEEGADIGTFGASALRCADFGNNCANIKLLLSSGADINDPATKGSRTLLQRATWEDNPEAIRYLIDQGADINAPASHSNGGTALQMAASFGYAALAKLLLTLGADVNSAPSRSGGETALEAAAGCWNPSTRAELFKFLSTVQRRSGGTGIGALR
jgi:ankyrin repeat protein